MITKIIQNGNSKNGLQLLPVENVTSMTVVFDVEKSRDEFVSQFPKSLKIKTGTMSSMEGTFPCALIYTVIPKNQHGKINGVTGEKNEGGEKRIIKFYTALQIQLTNQ
ncbi:MAG: hypothetical protein H7X88_01785 [Gloeobacteraceae cyanobacterium ES-bin-316]|nr:hypothetical protein [Ferruginibacter sp.]